MTARDLRVRFTLDGLCVQSSGSMLSADRVVVRCPRPPPEGSALVVTLFRGDGPPARHAATVKRVSGAGSESGFEAKLEGAGPRPEAVAPAAGAGFPQPPRVHARIASAREFVIEHAKGLGNGVLFVPMQSPPAVGTMVELFLELPDQGPVASCDALVVRVVAEGSGAGASLKCLGVETSFHKRVEGYFALLADRQRR